MSGVREKGLSFLKKRLGEIPLGHIAVSKYYSTEESWTKSPVWWFDLPLKKLHETNYKYVHLLCHIKKGKNFHYLRVPTSFVMKKLNALKVCTCNRKKVVRLHLSAQEEDLFCDLRGLTRVNFDRWLQEIPVTAD